MKNITLKELAKQLNLSVPTVSRALNDSYEISQETKDKVNALAQELNYRPNPFASSLRKNRSKTIALVIPEISSVFFSQITKGVEAVANNKGYHVIICCSDEKIDKETEIIQHLIDGRVDGVLLSTSAETTDGKHLESFVERKIPVVLFDRTIENMPFSSVTSNDYESSYAATVHLIENNCNSIGFLKFGKNLQNIEKRLKGYQQALTDYNLKPNNNLILTLEQDADENIEKIKRFILNKKPDALFASVEHLAMATYDACKQIDLTIPNNLKLLAYSNLNIARHFSPPLTTIVQPAYEIGESSATLLLNLLKNKHLDEIEDLMIDSEISFRASTEN